MRVVHIANFISYYMVYDDCIKMCRSFFFEFQFTICKVEMFDETLAQLMGQLYLIWALLVNQTPA